MREPAATGQETLLLVEDEAQVRQQGYQMLEASNGWEGLAVAEQHAGPIPLLLTDVQMPHLSGDDMAEQLRACRPSSAMDVLYKPISLAALTQRVREILDRE